MTHTARAPEVAAARRKWLDSAVPLIAAHPAVRGLAVVGSLGRGDEDDWSDVDLLVVVDSVSSLALSDLASFGDLAFSIDARRNVRVGAASYGAMFVVDGLPLGTDWYVWPKATASWPVDAAILLGAESVRRSELSFAALNDEGERNTPLPPTTTETRLGRLGMVAIAAKYVARRSVKAAPVIQHLGGSPADAPADQLRELRRLAEVYGQPTDEAWVPVQRLLALVEQHLPGAR